MDFSTITTNIAFMYLLLLIVILLMYIAFIKKPRNRKNQKK